MSSLFAWPSVTTLTVIPFRCADPATDFELGMTFPPLQLAMQLECRQSLDESV